MRIPNFGRRPQSLRRRQKTHLRIPRVARVWTPKSARLRVRHLQFRVRHLHPQMCLHRQVPRFQRHPHRLNPIHLQPCYRLAILWLLCFQNQIPWLQRQRPRQRALPHRDLRRHLNRKAIQPRVLLLLLHLHRLQRYPPPQRRQLRRFNHPRRRRSFQLPKLFQLRPQLQTLVFGPINGRDDDEKVVVEWWCLG